MGCGCHKGLVLRILYINAKGVQEMVARQSKDGLSDCISIVFDWAPGTPWPEGRTSWNWSFWFWPTLWGLNCRKFHSFHTEDFIGRVKLCCAASKAQNLELMATIRWYTGFLSLNIALRFGKNYILGGYAPPNLYFSLWAFCSLSWGWQTRTKSPNLATFESPSGAWPKRSPGWWPHLWQIELEMTGWG